MKKLIKAWSFSSQDRERYDLSGGLRIKRGLEVPTITQAASPTPAAKVYDTSTTLTASTWVAFPRAVKAWSGFGIELRAPKLSDQNATDPLYGIQFRIGDGADDFYWDGAAWSVAGPADWSSLSDVSTNLSQLSVSSRKIRVTVNMWTEDSRVTPRLLKVKVLYEADLDEGLDLIYGSLVHELKENVFARARVGYTMPADSNTLDMSDMKALGVDTTYDVVGVLASYNHTTDPEHLSDLTDVFDTGAKILTLTQAVLTGEILWVEFEYSLTVVVQTSQDYYELSSMPRLAVTEVREIATPTARSFIEEYVIDEDTGAGWKVHGPRVADVSIDIEVMADKQYDREWLRGRLNAWVTNTPNFIARGMDEEFDLATIGGPSFTSSGNRMNISTASITIEISNYTFFDRPTEAVYAVQNLNFTGGNVVVTIPA